MIETVTIARDETICWIAPELGGAILSCEVAGRALFRRLPGRPRDVLETACFALVPFANRIASGRLRCGTRRIALPSDPEAAPHALHGHGWRSRWDVAAVKPRRATLVYEHRPGAWPWRYRARQTIEATANGLRITLAVENLSGRRMPCGLGLHPYFARDNVSFIETGARMGQMLDDAACPLPPRSWRKGRFALREVEPHDLLLLTEKRTVVAGTAHGVVSIRASEVVGWQFFAPLGADYFCLEPVSHRPGEFGEEDMIEPEGTMRAWWTITFGGAGNRMPRPRERTE